MLKVSKKMLIYVVGKKPRCRYDNLKEMPFAKLLLKQQIEVLAYMLGRLLELAEDDEGIEEKDLIQLIFRIGHYIYYIISRRCTKDVFYTRGLSRGTDLFTNSRVWSLWAPSSREHHTDAFGRFQEFISCANHVYNTYTVHRERESISSDLSFMKHNFSYMITYLMNDMEALMKRKYPEYDAELLPKTEKKTKTAPATTPIAASPVSEEPPTPRRRTRSTTAYRRRADVDNNPYFNDTIEPAYPFLYAPYAPVTVGEREITAEPVPVPVGMDEEREERMPRLDEILRPMRDLMVDLDFDPRAEGRTLDDEDDE